MAYLRQTCWPVDLAVFYPHPGSAISSTEVAAAAVLLMVITAIAVWEVRRRPYLFVGWFWFTGMLVPVIGLIQVGTQRADRYTYLPQIGLFISAVWALGAPGKARWWTVARIAGATVAAAAFSILTLRQIDVWHDNPALGPMPQP